MIRDSQFSGLDGVLNEARLNAFYISDERRMAQIWFDCLTVDANGDEPEDSFYGFWLYGITRVAVSLRNAAGDDPASPALPLSIDDLTDAVHSFGAMSVYGWEFFDNPDERWAHWRERLSLDLRLDGRGGSHTLDLFQEDGTTRHLDIRIWFGGLSVTRRDGPEVDADDLIAASVRWWTALHAGDPRVQGHGIISAGEWSPPSV